MRNVRAILRVALWTVPNRATFPAFAAFRPHAWTLGEAAWHWCR